MDDWEEKVGSRGNVPAPAGYQRGEDDEPLFAPQAAVELRPVGEKRTCEAL
jgi:hypothetical protein